MNLYTHARKYIDVKDLRHLHEEKIKKRNIAELKKQQEIILAELEKIKIETSPKFCNWRRELREQMTTGAMMSATLPPQDLASFTTDMIIDQDLLNNDSLFPVDGTSRDVGGGPVWTMNNSPDPGSAAVVASFNADLSRMDKISVSVHFTNATIDTDGADVVISGPPGSGLEQVIALDAPGSGSGFVNHNANPTITIDPALRVKGASVSFSFVGRNIDGTRQIGNDAVEISSCFPYRSQPMSVIVGLDDPEAVSFIRTDPTMMGLSAAQREKKLLEMLEAGDEYLLKQLGIVGSSARPQETKDPVSWEQAQLSPRTEKEIDAMLLKGLLRGDYGRGEDVERQIRSLRRNQQNNTPGGMQVQGNKETQLAKTSDNPADWPSRHDLPTGPMGPSKDIPWVPEAPKAKRKSKKTNMVAHYKPQGKLLSENQKRILREIKKPVKVKEIPTKVKVKPTGRKNKSVGVDMMKIPEIPNQFKPPAPSIWSAKDREKNIRASQERKNEVLELVGAAEHHWTYLTEKKRKEDQEKVNEMMSAEFDKHLELMYENHRIKEERMNKVIKAVKKSSDLAPEYPENPPPQPDPETGMHPKYGKHYKHDKLDPHSAEAMPPTGNPEIDANIKKATNAKEKARKLKILMGKTKRG